MDNETETNPDSDDAIQALREALRVSPHNAALRLHFAETLLSHGLADEAEKEAVKLKLIEFFERQLREHKLDNFDALVTEVRNFGVFVELPQFMLSGLIHVSTLNDDFYQFEPTRQKLVGKRTRRAIQAGDKVKVEVDRVDRFKKQVDFRLSDESDSKSRKKNR